MPDIRIIQLNPAPEGLWRFGLCQGFWTVLGVDHAATVAAVR
jgi:hypothetical protein